MRINAISKLTNSRYLSTSIKGLPCHHFVFKLDSAKFCQMDTKNSSISYHQGTYMCFPNENIGALVMGNLDFYFLYILCVSLTFQRL